MNLEHMFGPGLSVQVVCALGDYHHRAPLLLQPGLTLGYSQMGSTGLPVQSQLSPVMVKLPDPGRCSREGLWGRQVLCMHKQKHVLTQNSNANKVKRVVFRGKDLTDNESQRLGLTLRLKRGEDHIFFMKDYFVFFPEGKSTCSPQHVSRLCNKHHSSWLLLPR